MGLSTILRAGTTAADADGIARPSLVHRDGIGWDLLYSGLADGTWRVCRAFTASPEPRGFLPAGPPLPPGPPGSGEELGVRSPCAVPTSDGGLLVVYAGLGPKDAIPDAPPGAWSLFSAWAPAQPGPLEPAWQRLGQVLAAGQPGDADAAGCDHPTLARVGQRRWLWYTADDGLSGGARIAAASSGAGEPWQRHGVVLGRGAPGQPDDEGSEAPSVIVHRRSGWPPGGFGQVEMVYTGRSTGGARVLRARSGDGVSFDRLGPVVGPGLRDAGLAVGPDGRAWLVAVADGAVVAGPAAM
jgi:hypothetical protein